MFYVTEIVLSLGFADAIFRRERSDDRKCVCASQARVTDDGTAVSLSSVHLIQWNPVSSNFLGKRKLVRDIGKFEKKKLV